MYPGDDYFHPFHSNLLRSGPLEEKFRDFCGVQKLKFKISKKCIYTHVANKSLKKFPPPCPLFTPL